MMFDSNCTFKQIRDTVTVIIHNGTCAHKEFEQLCTIFFSVEGELQLGSWVFQTYDTGCS